MLQHLEAERNGQRRAGAAACVVLRLAGFLCQLRCQLFRRAGARFGVHDLDHLYRREHSQSVLQP